MREGPGGRGGGRRSVRMTSPQTSQPLLRPELTLAEQLGGVTWVFGDRIERRGNRSGRSKVGVRQLLAWVGR